MTTGQMFGGIAIIIIALIFILFPEARTLFMGFGKLFFKDMATTPEGAEAIYEEKIDEAQDRYNKANNALRIAAGRLSNAQTDLKNLQAKLIKVEKDCEALVQKGDITNAEIKAEEREEIISSIERTKQLVEAFTTAKQEAEQVYKLCEDQLKKLKKESKEIVENMKVKQQLAEAYDDIDELKNVTATDKLLNQVREKNKDLNASVEGAKVVHNSKLSTKIQKADEAAKKAQGNDYLESLKKKYNK